MADKFRGRNDLYTGNYKKFIDFKGILKKVHNILKETED
jgi:hypothetical protein